MAVEYIDAKEFTRDVVVEPIPNKTNSSKVVGAGIFDDIMETVTTHLQTQADSGRFKGESYAAVYSELMARTLEVALQYLTQSRQADLILAQIENQKADTALKAAQLPILQEQLLVEKERLKLLTAQAENEKAKLPLIAAQVKSEEAKTVLYERQTKGFDDDAKQKIIKILFDVWGIAFSVAKDNPDLDIPEGIKNPLLDSVVKDIVSYSNLGNDATGGIKLNTNPFEGDFT